MSDSRRQYLSQQYPSSLLLSWPQDALRRFKAPGSGPDFSRSNIRSRVVRPVCVLRFRISEGSTQAESGIPMFIGNFPEILSQEILAERIFSERLAVSFLLLRLGSNPRLGGLGVSPLQILLLFSNPSQASIELQVIRFAQRNESTPSF